MTKRDPTREIELPVGKPVSSTSFEPVLLREVGSPGSRTPDASVTTIDNLIVRPC
jgi:hypothetical protein